MDVFSKYKIVTVNPQRYSNAIGTCFFDKACIAKREAKEQEQQQQVMQQQQLLANVSSQSSGRLSGGMIALIVFGVITATGLTIYMIKKRKR